MVIPRSMKGIPILGTYTQNPYQLRSLLSFSSPQKKTNGSLGPQKLEKMCPHVKKSYNTSPT